MPVLYRYFVKSNIFIGLGACCFYLSGKLLFGIKYISADWEILLILFLGTILIYHISQKPIDRLLNIRAGLTYQLILLGITGLVLIWLASFLTLKFIVFFCVLGLLAFLYNSLAFSNIKFLPLRSLPLLKLFIIAFVWASIGTTLPFMELKILSTQKLIMVFITQSLFIMAIALPFDIRDFYKDYKNNLRTVPGVIGISKTKKIAYSMLILHFIGIITIDYKYTILYLPFVILTFVLIKNSSMSKPNHYYTFFIDGMIILQFLSFYFSEFILN